MDSITKTDSNLEKHIRFNTNEIGLNALQKLQLEVGETPEIRKIYIQRLRRQLHDMKDLYPCLDENFLLQFLRVSKFDDTKVISRIVKYYRQQEKYPDMFGECSYSHSKMQNFRHLWALPYRLEDGSVVVIYKGGLVDYSVVTYDERLYLEIISLSQLLQNPLNQLCGVTIILDYKGFNFNSFLAHTPTKEKLFIDTFQNTFPLRIKACHIIHVPSSFTLIFNLTYPFLSNKIRNRLFVHPNDNWKSLHLRIPPDILPEEYGGYLKQGCMIDLLANFKELEEKFCEQLKYGYIRSKDRRSCFQLVSS